MKISHFLDLQKYQLNNSIELINNRIDLIRKIIPNSLHVDTQKITENCYLLIFDNRSLERDVLITLEYHIVHGVDCLAKIDIFENRTFAVNL
jgi:hypothetical protein